MHFPCVVHLKSLPSRLTAMSAIRSAIAGKDPLSSVGSLVSFQLDREPCLCGFNVKMITGDSDVDKLIDGVQFH